MTDHFTQHLFERVWSEGFWNGVEAGIAMSMLAAIIIVRIVLIAKRKDQ